MQSVLELEHLAIERHAPTHHDALWVLFKPRHRDGTASKIAITHGSIFAPIIHDVPPELEQRLGSPVPVTTRADPRRLPRMPRPPHRQVPVRFEVSP